MIKLIKSTFYKEEETKRELCKFISKTEKLSFGTQCESFEKNFAKWQGRKYCIFLNSGSSANLAIVQAILNLGLINKGDLVAFSALTWSTNVMPLIQLGLTSVPVDVELDTLNVSSHTLTRVLNKYPIKLVFLTNLLGFCDDIDKIKDICVKKNIILIEDNCEALGTIYKGKKLGNYGLASTFSFYVGHHMSTIEGGAVCTDSEEMATMLKIVRAHGWDRNLDFTQKNKIRVKFKVNSAFYSRYTFYDLGYNLRPTEINGFIGNYQIKFLNKIIEKRAENFKAIAPALYKNEKLYYSLRYSHINLFSNFAIPLVCRSQEIRDMLVRRSRGKIEIRPIVGGNMTKQPFFQKYIKTFPVELYKNANIAHEQGLYFGNNPELTRKEIDEIISIFTNNK